MILGLDFISFMLLFGLPAVVIGIMFWYCRRIAAGDD